MTTFLEKMEVVVENVTFTSNVN